MPLDDAHIDYLTSHHQGRLATVAPNGNPQNKPVGYLYNAQLGTIDIAGIDMEHSAKYRNVASHPNVAFVVDDAIGEGPDGMRFLEVRGPAEQVHEAALPAPRPGVNPESRERHQVAPGRANSRRRGTMGTYQRSRFAGKLRPYLPRALQDQRDVTFCVRAVPHREAPCSSGKGRGA